MLEAAKPYLGHKFDQTISVQEAGYFKPHRKTYEKAVELIGLEVMECMHVANHTFDCVGAKAAGMRSAFIDRRDRPVSSVNERATHSGSFSTDTVKGVIRHVHAFHDLQSNQLHCFFVSLSMWFKISRFLH